MIPKQALASDWTPYLPALAALAAGTYGYISGDEDEDVSTRLLRALGYGAMAGVGTSLVSDQLTTHTPKLLGFPSPVEDPDLSRIIGAVGAGLAGAGLANLVPNWRNWKYVYDPKVREKLLADLYNAEGEVAGLEKKLQAHYNSMKNNQGNVNQQKRAINRIEKQLQVARANLAQLKSQRDMMQLRGSPLAKTLGVVLGGLLGWGLSG